MEQKGQVSLKNLITSTKEKEEMDFVEENTSQKGSIIDLFRRDSALSMN